MGYTRQLGQLAYLITFDGSGNITVPASLTQGSVTSSMLKADAGGKLVAAVAGTDFVAPAGLSAYVPTTRTLTINGTTFDLSADRSWTIVSGVSSFNTRTGAITLTSGDVTTALGYTPVTNARTLTINGTTFDLSADRSWSIVAGLSSFNTRTGAITLLDTDVTGALGYTPVTNARTITINGTTFDLSANRTWVVDTSSVTTRVIQKFTATSSQTTFTITGGYTVGMVDVFLNGIKLDNATEFTASNGSTVVLALGAATGDIVEVYKYGGQFIANNTLRQSTLFTTTAGQTTFTVNYSVGFVDVFYNGSKLDSSEFTATNGTSIVLGTACVLNDKVEVIAYNYTVGAFTGVGGSGTTNYISKWTASGTLNNSLIFDNGTALFIGNGQSSATPQTAIVEGTDGSGTNIAGAEFRIQGGQGTGTGVGGPITFYTAPAGSTGSSLNAALERMRITTTGNVGIGTSSPTTFSGNTTLAINNSAGGAVLELQSNGTSALRMATSSSDSALWEPRSVPVLFATNNTERMRITNAGNIGINNSNPTGRLHINSNDTPSISGTNPTGAFIIQSTASTALTMGVFQNNPFYGWMQMRHGNLSDIAYGLAIQPLGGNVGIGTSVPLSRLHIGPEGSVGGNTPTIIMSSASGTKPMMLITEYTARSGGFGYDSSNFMTLATEASVTAGFKFKVGSSFQNGLLNTGTEALVINNSAQITKPNNPAFRAYYSVNGFWYVNNTDTLVFDLTEYNIGNCYNTSNGRFTAPVAGVYQFNFYSIVWSNLSNGALTFRKNGGAPTSGHNIHFSPSTSGAWSNVVYTTSLYLNAGDYVFLVNGSGFQLPLHGDDWSSFSGYLVG